MRKSWFSEPQVVHIPRQADVGEKIIGQLCRAARLPTEVLEETLVPCQPGIDKLPGLPSNLGGFGRDPGTESDHEPAIHRAPLD
jgi:hypothetical protein